MSLIVITYIICLLSCSYHNDLDKIRSEIEPSIIGSLEYPESYEFISIVVVDTLDDSKRQLFQIEELDKLIDQFPDEDAYKAAKQEVQLMPFSNYQIVELKYRAKDSSGDLQDHSHLAKVLIK